jgi:hypothetical protein
MLGMTVPEVPKPRCSTGEGLGYATQCTIPPDFECLICGWLCYYCARRGCQGEGRDGKHFVDENYQA